MCIRDRFKTGYINRFPSPNAAYGYYCGKVLGKILDIFCTVSIALSTLIMFAGSGATVNQYLGAPVWVGTLVMGVVSVVVVCFGLEKVTNVLGFAGTLIIVILIGVGIYCFCTADSGVMQAQQNVQQYVDAGVIMRANFLGIENPILAVITAVLGVSVASVIPLDKLVNFIYPLIGAAGLVIFVGIVIKLVTEGRAPAAENK